MHATISHFDPITRAGRAVLDDGVELSFDSAAFDAGGLRHVRLGQRVRLEIEPGSEIVNGQGATADETAPEPAVRAVWLATMRPLP